MTRRLAELIEEAEREGVVAALDAVANALANALVRRHEVDAPPQRITTMEGLMEETREWNYNPGMYEARQIIAEYKEELAREREEREEQHAYLRRLAARVVPDMDIERAKELSPEELRALIDKHI